MSGALRLARLRGALSLRRVWQRLLRFAGAALALWLAGCAQAPVDLAPHLATPAEIDALVPAEMARAGAQGLAVAVIDAGQVTHVRAFGRRNTAGQALREDTVMVAASFTKPVFAYAVLQLVDEGRLGLDVPVARLLAGRVPGSPAQPPWLPGCDLAGDPRWQAITPRMLLSHHAGLPNLPAQAREGGLCLLAEPGARYAYSGIGFNLLQWVLAQGLGLDAEAEVQRRVFQRFGMHRSSLTWQAGLADNQADGHRADGSVRPHPRRRRAAAASSMDTTITDHARFVAGLLRGDGLSVAARQALTTSQGPITTPSQFPTFQAELPAARRRPDLAAGLGLVLFNGPQGPGFFKGGHEDFAGNTWVCLARPGRCVVLMSNDVRAERAFAAIVAAILGETGAPWAWEYGR